MMGREKRAQFLVPSFVFAAASALAACGGTSVGEAGGASTSGAAGAQVSTNPSPASWGGQIATNPPPIGSSGGGSGGSGNSGGYGNEGGDIATNPPAVVTCPESVPRNGSACIPPAQGGPAECIYDPNDACTTTLAWCTDGHWTLGGYAIDCRGWGGDGGIGGEPPIAEAGAAGEGPSEPDPAVGCPPTLPAVGAYCYKPSSVTSYRCDYPVTCGSYQATCVGQWQLTLHGSTTAPCAGGAPGI
ncbi:MAG: hypothetical protein ABJB12_11005 [Pseudomonadota bacterium]